MDREPSLSNAPLRSVDFMDGKVSVERMGDFWESAWRISVGRSPVWPFCVEAIVCAQFVKGWEGFCLVVAFEVRIQESSRNYFGEKPQA
jgi:hypothetical protein